MPSPNEMRSDAADAAVPVRIVPGVVDVVVLAPSSQPGKDGKWLVLALERGLNTRCSGAWEIVHGRIERGERPEHAALREVKEETGLTPERLYSVTVNSFYLHQTGTVQLALVFAAIVAEAAPVALSSEHSRFRWCTLGEAGTLLAWPREREALVHVSQLLATGDAGPVEDVLRIL